MRVASIPPKVFLYSGAGKADSSGIGCHDAIRRIQTFSMSLVAVKILRIFCFSKS